MVFALVALLARPRDAIAQDPPPPNFVVILVDDLGWMDLSCYGSKYYETPNVDRLAATGARFSDGYAACAVCSPTRAALLTGRYPARLGVTDWIRAGFQGGKASAAAPRRPEYQKSSKRALLCPTNGPQLESSETTLAEALAPAGYVSCHIGKWHLGVEKWYPTEQGFDENIGGCDYGQPPRYFYPYKTKQQGSMPGLAEGEEGEYLTDREGHEAVRFIERNKDKPFFLYLAHYAVHAPIQAKKELVSKYQAKQKQGQKNAAYAAMIESVDHAVGRVLDTLDRLKLTERTVVIFTSDNGGLSGVTNNAPLRAGKGTMYEGGIRVPLILRWPEVTEPGSVRSEPVSSVDFFPTILDIAGVDFELKSVDGESLVPLLVDDEKLKRQAIFWHFPHYRGRDITPYGAVRAGDFKLIRRYETGDVELYNLKQDLGEKKDLASTMPERAQQLDVMLSKWLISTKAKMPKPNPAYKKPATPAKKPAAKKTPAKKIPAKKTPAKKVPAKKAGPAT